MEQPIFVTIDECLKDLATPYLEKREKELLLIPEALRQGNFEAIQTIGHKISGNAGMFGLTQLGELAARLEKEADHRNLQNVLDISTKMTQLIKKVRFISDAS